MIEAGLSFAELGEGRTMVVATADQIFPTNLGGYQQIVHDLNDTSDTNIAALLPKLATEIREQAKPLQVRAICLSLRLPPRQIAARDGAFESFRRLRETFVGADRPARIQPCHGGAVAIWENDLRTRTILRMASRFADEGASVGVATGDLLRWGSQYYGNALQRSSSFMLAASPHGLVCDHAYGLEPGDDGIPVAQLVERSMFVAGISTSKRTNCYCSSSVLDWRCLSWPGLEHPGKTTLNRPGVTFLTHQGLPGHIENMKLHPGESVDYTGDVFELIIDDFDTLVLYHEHELLDGDLPPRLPPDFHGANPTSPYSTWSQVLKEMVCAALLRTPKFLFVPIRCGLNAIAVRTDADDALREGLDKCTTYESVMEFLIDNKRKVKVGVFDNQGATIPLLLRASFPKLKDIYRKVTAQELRTSVDRLFRTSCVLLPGMLPSQAASSPAEVILGGGAWLNDPADPKWTIHYPQNDGAFLWLEGAAANRKLDPESLGQLMGFLKREALGHDFQTNLRWARPYASCPVTPKAIEERIGDESDEVSRIFRRTENGMGFELRSNITVRGDRGSTPDVRNAWRASWERITARKMS